MADFVKCRDPDCNAVARGKPHAHPERPKPEWQRIIDLFKQHGLPEPPWRLRDELVVHLVAYNEIKDVRAKLEIAREGLKDVASRAHSRLANTETL